MLLIIGYVFITVPNAFVSAQRCAWRHCCLFLLRSVQTNRGERPGE